MIEEYTAPETQQTVEPERIISGWIKKPILYLISSYLLLNFINFGLAGNFRDRGMSKSEIEEKIDGLYDNKLIKFLMNDLSKPGRELAYLINKKKK